ncbi:MAG: hypothetical protein A2600_08910 [Candidatus Lambdaproteobacteria bacterium RIFOXYD1_FULL_56_27]|uniref:Uncharacterized protein n=1 Tax=Candidatus Lambdaproteobacteria bacterium RIFOXYD2_FULL_56_26 TaxID=1817773 RepID=A0A1F6GYX0_9PROT|nr:MAG: hypothetical protein A2426_10330 [Candidatus Lambdaproteobacteria bacterium RIFOXYC1_FULL_56_13]OGH03345.1 MAG: hypothetical protein A2557_02355 [Candidatus Lambdaproteobacteria bacterium RIFOXYD2_FULL_56_26]OGH06650.1 MAG: hypothetical protein A2600_08910 [Candidatus Lambdaproteobacteria bacterium RIFOXYD1_FULL_56_27]
MPSCGRFSLAPMEVIQFLLFGTFYLTVFFVAFGLMAAFVFLVVVGYSQQRAEKKAKKSLEP